jgi:Predicted signal transduction protein with a C-terminal ATPase domain
VTERKNFLGIRVKMILCCIFTTIVTIILSDFAIYRIYQNDIVNKQFEYMKDANQILADNISNLINIIEEKLVSEVEYCSVFSYQDDLGPLYIADMERNLKSVATIMRMRGTDVKSIYVLDQYSCSYYYDTDEKNHLGDFKKKEVYKQIREKQKKLFPRQASALWRCYEDEPDEIYLIKRYIDSESTDYKGIICLTFDKSYLQTLLGDHDFSSVIYDENGNLLYCSEELRQTRIWEKEAVRKQYMISSTTVGRKGWRLEALVNKDTILVRMKSLINTLLLLELIVLAGVILVITYLFKGMLKNILALSKNFKDINAGRKAAYIYPRTKDETAYLCRQFNIMYEELTQSVEKMAQDSTLREKAEYNALLAQLNPHFLYNSLESISSIAKLSGQEEIVRAIHMLGHLLRVSISGKEQKIPLREEMRYIHYYLELQKMVTAGTHLEWDFSIEAGTEDYLVPKLLLQPVVENAILHGLNNIARDGIIVITSNKRNDYLVLEVYDNGEGARQEDIDCILAEEEADDPQRNRDHIGIRSIQKRIHILYGSAYGMQMESSLGNGMIVKITLPLEKEENV